MLSNPLPRLARPMSTNSEAFLTPIVGSNSNASVRLKMAAAAPMPSASETMDVSVNTGRRPSNRTECRRSVVKAIG